MCVYMCVLCVCGECCVCMCYLHASICVFMCERKSKLSGMFRLGKKAGEMSLPRCSKPLFITLCSLFFGALVAPYTSVIKCATFVIENVQLDQFSVGEIGLFLFLEQV